MKLKSLLPCLITALTLPLVATPSLSQAGNSQPEGLQFICANSRKTNTPTTYVWNQGQKRALVQWTSTLGGGEWTPERRCQEVSPKLQEAYQSGSLNYIRNGTQNNLSVICVAREYRGGCDRLLFTLRPGDDPNAVLQQLNGLLNGQNLGPIQQSPNAPRYIKVDLRQFLRNAPVEEE